MYAITKLLRGSGKKRGSMVISGANGIVGAGKTMQFASRLQPFGIRNNFV